MNITLGASRSVYVKAEIIAGSGARTEVVFHRIWNAELSTFLTQVCSREKPNKRVHSY